MEIALLVATVLFTAYACFSSEISRFYDWSFRASGRTEVEIWLPGVITRYDKPYVQAVGWDMEHVPSCTYVRTSKGHISFSNTALSEIGLEVVVIYKLCRAPWPASRYDKEEYYYPVRMERA